MLCSPHVCGRRDRCHQSMLLLSTGITDVKHKACTPLAVRLPHSRDSRWSLEGHNSFAAWTNTWIVPTFCRKVEASEKERGTLGGGQLRAFARMDFTWLLSCAWSMHTHAQPGTGEPRNDSPWEENEHCCLSLRSSLPCAFFSPLFCM